MVPGLNFINILHTAFTLADSKSVKSYWWLNCFFTLLGSTSVKAVHKTFVKLTPGFLKDNLVLEKWLINYGLFDDKNN